MGIPNSALPIFMACRKFSSMAFFGRVGVYFGLVLLCFEQDGMLKNVGNAKKQNYCNLQVSTLGSYAFRISLIT